MPLDIEYLKKTYASNDDLIVRDFALKKNVLHIAFLESLCNSKMIYDFIIKNVENCIVFDKKIRDIKSIISSPKIVAVDSREQLFYYLENGFCLVFYKDSAYAIEVKADIDRGITLSQTEPNMYGPKDAFCENYQKNLGVLKRRIKNKDLKTESIEQGIYTKNKVSIIYIASLTNKNVVDKIKERLNEYAKREVNDSYDVASELRLNKVFPTIQKSEKPSVVAKFLLKGYVVIMIDNTPFVLIMDSKFQDFINPTSTDKFVKVLRYMCFILTVMTPAIYIALINFNQEMIPMSLFVKFAEQRDSVPFPALVEAIMMLFTCEILREADIRFPNSYGSAASILGALILGESAVSAGIVSAIMIIIVAITFISSLIFTDIKLLWEIRILRITLLLVASIIGLYGLSFAIIALLSIIANVKMYDGEYL